MIKPMLASDFDQDKVKFPCLVQPKIDGVRALNLDGRLTGRSLKTHANVFTTEQFSRPEYVGLDGEMIHGEITDQDLCRNTTSALNSIKGEPSIVWHVFDYITEDTLHRPYQERYEMLAKHLDDVRPANAHLVPSKLCHSLEQLLEAEEVCLSQGFEGIILRDPNGVYKSGRSTVREGGLLRVKRFMEEDALVVGIEEGRSNGNEARVNELGRTERSTHQENMMPNGLVGSLLCVVSKNVSCPITKKLLLIKGQAVTVSPGNMDHAQRREYFEDQSKLLGKTIKFKFFPKGLKDKPRFPTFVSIRAESDKCAT